MSQNKRITNYILPRNGGRESVSVMAESLYEKCLSQHGEVLQNRVQEFSRHLSHDLRTPLTTVITSLHLLQHYMTPDGAKYYERLEKGINQVEKVVMDLLAWNDMEAYEQNHPLLPTNLLFIVQGLLERMEHPATQKELNVYVENHLSAATIGADAETLQDALWRILENALTHTPNGGTIFIRLYQQRNHYCFDVEDSGSGIGPDVLPHIFEPFFRGDPSRNTISGASGLGLTIAQRVIENHRGDISVASEVGEGTRFMVRLPILQRPC